MKKSLFLSAVLMTSYLVIPSISYAYSDNVARRICEYVQANDKERLRFYLKQQKLKIRDIFDDIRCNDKDLLVFAAYNKSLEAGEFLIGKIQAKKVTNSYDEIAKYSAHLAETAKNRSK
jgi:hypothetical protein